MSGAPLPAALHDAVDDLHHDLGKAIVFLTRATAPDDPAALREALTDDILRTRRSGAAVEPAAAIWARRRPAALADDPDVRAIDAAFARLARIDLAAADADLPAAAAAARAVADACRRLKARCGRP